MGITLEEVLETARKLAEQIIYYAQCQGVDTQNDEKRKAFVHEFVVEMRDTIDEIVNKDAE